MADSTRDPSGNDLRRIPADLQLARWAEREHGLVTVPQLRAVGLSASMVHYRVRQGRLFPVFDGVWSLGGPPRSRHAVFRAVTLSFGADARLSHTAAADLYALLRHPLGGLHVTTPRKLRPRQGVVPHHASDGAPWRIVDGIPVTSPEQTILDCGLLVTSDRAYRRLVRQAQVDRLATFEALVAFCRGKRGRPGVVRLRRELATGPMPTRSVFEDETVDGLWSGERPRLNEEVHGVEVHLYFPAKGIVVEGAAPQQPAVSAPPSAPRCLLLP